MLLLAWKEQTSVLRTAHGGTHQAGTAPRFKELRASPDESQQESRDLRPLTAGRIQDIRALKPWAEDPANLNLDS